MSNRLNEWSKIWQMPNYNQNVDNQHFIIKKLAASFKLAASCVAICLLLTSSHHPVDPPFMAWTEGYALSPADYLAQADFNSTYQASTSYSVSNRWEWLNDNELQIEIICRFYPNASWIKPNPTAELLIHEQKHFDLGEIYARQMRKKLQSTKLMAVNCNEMVENIIQETRNDCFARQRAYDAATAHGIHAAQQQYWNELILNELTALQDYKNRQFSVFPK
jgi:hypothetical protein